MIRDVQTYLRIPTEPQQIFHIDPTRHLEQQKTFSLAPYEDAFFNFLDIQYKYMSFAIDSANAKLWYVILDARAKHNGVIADRLILADLPIVEQFIVKRNESTTKDQNLVSLHERAALQNIKCSYDSFVSHWQYSLIVFHYNMQFWYYFYFLREGQTDTSIQEKANKFRDHWRTSFYEYRDFIANDVFKNGTVSILDIDHMRVYERTKQYIVNILEQLKQLIEQFELLYL